jgi:type IV pilus assembly protein PilO
MALLPQDPQKQKMLLVGLLPVLLAFAYYQYYHTGRAEEVVTAQADVERLQASNAAMRTIVSRYGQDLEQRLAIYQAHIGQLEALIPRREDVPVLISQITERAHGLGVELAALNPSAEEAGDYYSRQSYELQVLGDYHSIGEYLTAIGSLPRIVKASDFKVSLDRPGTEPGEAPRLRALFRIETYIVPDAATVSGVETAASAGGNANANG